MKLVHVIPIARGIGNKETLSYFTSLDIPLGSLVDVEVRKKKIRALVVSSEDATEAKSKIRSSSFSIKKIEKVSSYPFLSPAFMRAVERTAKYFATTSGSILSAVISKNILDRVALKEKMPPSIKRNELLKSASVSEKLVFQTNDEDRLAAYKSHIREAFARNHSVFMLLPTNESAMNVKRQLEKGIELYTVSLSSSMSRSSLSTLWQKIENEKHPLLIIGTGAFLGIPRDDVSTIIVENESSGSYRTLRRPFIDFRVFAEFLAEEGKIKLILGDSLLRIETYQRHLEGDLIEWSGLKFRQNEELKKSLIDMKKYKQSSGTSFRILSDELQDLIQKVMNKKEKLFLFSARKGLSPITLCADCGEIVTCDRCSAPTVLYSSKKGEDENFFLCHHCGEKRSAKERCKNCGGWRLTALGIGIEKVEKEIENKFPDIKVFRLDKESASTEKRARDIIKKFHNSPGSILLGTEMALSYNHQPTPYSAIVSMDSLFSIPDFRINERIIHILTGIQNQTEKEMIVQTRNPEHFVLGSYFRNTLMDFYRQELVEREKFGYPPFKILIKITLEGKRAVALQEMAKIEKMFKEYSPYVFPAFISTVRGNFILHALIKTDKNNWPASTSESSLGGPNEDLLRKLITLPPYFTVKVDPESLL